ALPRIVGIECGGAPQQAFPFLRIAAEESRQLDEHLSLRGQCRRIVGGERQGGVDLPLHAAEFAQRCQEPLLPPFHLQSFSEVAEDGEVGAGVRGVCPHGLLGAVESHASPAWPSATGTRSASWHSASASRAAEPTGSGWPPWATAAQRTRPAPTR